MLIDHVLGKELRKKALVEQTNTLMELEVSNSFIHILVHMLICCCLSACTLCENNKQIYLDLSRLRVGGFVHKKVVHFKKNIYNV